jgi:hypothetical protein
MIRIEVLVEQRARLMGKKHAEERTPRKSKTPTFLLELPLVAEAGQAARVGAHLEVGRQFYNAVLSAGQQRLRRMRADPAQAGRPVPSPARTSRSGGLPFQPCGSATAFPNTPFMSWRKGCVSRGWPSTWMRCWPQLPRDAGQSCLPRPQPGVRGQGPPRPLIESRAGQAPRHRMPGLVKRSALPAESQRG